MTSNTPPLTNFVPIAAVPGTAGAENENVPVAPWRSRRERVSVPVPPLLAVVHVPPARVREANAVAVVRSMEPGIEAIAPSVIVSVPFVATIDSVPAVHEAARRHVAIHGVPSICALIVPRFERQVRPPVPDVGGGVGVGVGVVEPPPLLGPLAPPVPVAPGLIGLPQFAVVITTNDNARSPRHRISLTLRGSSASVKISKERMFWTAYSCGTARITKLTSSA